MIGDVDGDDPAALIEKQVAGPTVVRTELDNHVSSVQGMCLEELSDLASAFARVIETWKLFEVSGLQLVLVEDPQQAAKTFSGLGCFTVEGFDGIALLCHDGIRIVKEIDDVALDREPG